MERLEVDLCLCESLIGDRNGIVDGFGKISYLYNKMKVYLSGLKI